MNGLPLAQLSDVEKITSVDPLTWINEQHKRAIEQIQQQFTQNQAAISRQTDNKLQMRHRQYLIEVDALKRKYDSIPRSQRDAKVHQRARQEWDALNTSYQIDIERTRGKIAPDLQDLEFQRQQALQQLEWDRKEKIIRLQQIDESAQKWGTPREYVLQEKYALAGHNFPVGYFKQEDPSERLIGLAMKYNNAIESGDKNAAAVYKSQMDVAKQELAGISPDTIRAVEQRSTKSLAGLEIRKRVEKEGPKTLAEGIKQAKENASLSQEFAQSQGLVSTTKKKRQKQVAKTMYRRNKQTGEKQVSYDNGQTWQTI
jgi:hypothetical protein